MSVLIVAPAVSMGRVSAVFDAFATGRRSPKESKVSARANTRPVATKEETTMGPETDFHSVQSADLNGHADGVLLATRVVSTGLNRQYSRPDEAVSHERLNRQAPVQAPGGGASGVRLSILMPAYNEEQTILAAILNVLQAELPCEFELIVVDDGSSDMTGEVLSQLEHPKLRVITHPSNLGKGAALRTGAATAVGRYVVPFDSDLEYDSGDLAAMLEPVLQGRCHVVYGTRIFGVNTRYQSYRHAMGNRALTLAANVLFDSYISDMHTCLKLVPTTLFRQLRLEEAGFALDTELTAKILRMGLRPFEVPVTYHSRSPEQGKKLTWRAGIESLRVMARVRRGPSQGWKGDDSFPTLQEVADPVEEAIKHMSETTAARR
jgi:dolichol-phosphate hexosyltransferase